MEYRYSASFLKKWRACKFAVYCKMSKQKIDGEVDNSYGDAGTVVHHALEYWYNYLVKFDKKQAMQDLEKRFDLEWEYTDIRNPRINKNLYWLSVINGVQLKLEVTEVERRYDIAKPFHGIGFADVVNKDKNWIGDWKTATYKASKLKEFKEQLRFYAYAHWKEEGVIPMTWVFFNKVNKIFKYKWTEEQLVELENEILEVDKDIKERIKRMDFPRSASNTNCFFCDFKSTCATDLMREEKSENYNVTFNFKKNKLLVEASIPALIHRKLEKEMNYLMKNAHFMIQAMKQRGVHYDGIKRLYRRRSYGGETTIGYMHTCHRILKEYAHSQGMKFALTIKDFRNQEVMAQQITMPLRLNTEFDLYDFQEQAVETLINFRWGTCEIGTGGGKTAIAAEAIRRLATKTLFIIDGKDLLMQTKDEYEQMLGIECGVVGMGSRDFSKPITLATIQTLSKNAKEFAGELSKFSFVIYDECHGVACKTHEIVSKLLTNTKYRFSFSATARRDDGNTKLIYAHCGTIVISLPAKELIKRGVLVPPICTFYKYKADISPSADWQSEYVDYLVENDTRNQMIVSKAKELVKEGKQLMILCTRIKHCEYLLSQLPDAKLIYGGTKDDVRYDIKKEFNDGKFNILIGNLKIFNKGINIPSLDGVINAAGNAGDTLTVQTIGRPLRKAKGKTAAFYIDFVDNGEYLHKHSMSRIKALRDEEYKVVIEEWKK